MVGDALTFHGDAAKGLGVHENSLQVCCFIGNARAGA